MSLFLNCLYKTDVCHKDLNILYQHDIKFHELTKTKQNTLYLNKRYNYYYYYLFFFFNINCIFYNQL